MAQTTTVIFILATLLVPATVVSGQTPPSPVAPSPTINEAMNCAAGLTVCLPAFAQGGTPSKECCTAVKTQQSCLCGFIKAPVLVVPFNITAFSALISKSCGINTNLNLCSETPGKVLPLALLFAKKKKKTCGKIASNLFIKKIIICISFFPVTKSFRASLTYTPSV